MIGQSFCYNCQDLTDYVAGKCLECGRQADVYEASHPMYSDNRGQSPEIQPLVG